MSGCCDEPGCRRKQPLRLIRNRPSGQWFVVTEAIDKGGDGQFIATKRHRLPAEVEQQLNAMLQSRNALVALEAAGAVVNPNLSRRP